MRYQSTPEKEFDGDIIITDPCYIIRNENEITENDWHYCECGEYMERLGIKNYLTHDTIFGDWGCTVFDSDTKKPLGHFCADAGLVSVFLLDEVLAYNPNFNYHLEKPWTTTLIPDFKGTVQIEVVRETGTYEKDSEYWNAARWRKTSFSLNKALSVPILRWMGKKLLFGSAKRERPLFL